VSEENYIYHGTTIELSSDKESYIFSHNTVVSLLRRMEAFRDVCSSQGMMGRIRY